MSPQGPILAKGRRQNSHLDSKKGPGWGKSLRKGAFKHGGISHAGFFVNQLRGPNGPTDFNARSRGKVGIARAAVDGNYTANRVKKMAGPEGPGHDGMSARQRLPLVETYVGAKAVGHDFPSHWANPTYKVRWSWAALPVV